jgi:hypothetical protein
MNTGLPAWYLKRRGWHCTPAILCTSAHYLPHAQRSELAGAPGEGSIAKKLYMRCVQQLLAADYLSNHSVRSLQTICLIVMFAHEHGGSNLVAVLLNCAIRIAQSMGLHRLAPEPRPDQQLNRSLQSIVDRELKKSIWLFLSIQDWLMIPFI